MSSSSSSSDETDAEDRNNGMKTLADLMWQKLKSDKKICPTASTRANGSDSNVDRSATKPKLFMNLSSTAKVFGSGVKPASTSGTASLSTRSAAAAASSTSSSSAASSSTSSSTQHGIRSIHQSKAEEALKDIQTGVTSLESQRQRKKQAKEEKSKWMWKSGTWGSMRMKEKTLEDKRDLMLLNMRSTIDPNHHYKHSDVKAPQFFQIGTVQDSPESFYFDRIPKKKRKRTLLDELMADQDFRKNTKKRYMEVVAAKAGRKGLFQRAPPQKIKLKKRKK